MKLTHEQRDQVLSLLNENDNTEALTAYLKTHPTLELMFCELNAHSVVRLMSALKSNINLLSLTFKYNNLSSEAIQNLSEALKQNTTLRKLHLIDNVLDTESMQYLAESLKQNTTLKKLSLINGKLNDQGIQYLSEALKVNTSLQSLDLQSNDLYATNLQPLSEALKKNNTLQHLNLGRNYLSDKDAQLLSQILINNTTLKKLDLYWNNFHAKGTQYLSSALQVNTALHSLDLYRNNLDDQDAYFLSKALQANKILQNLHLRGNKMSSTGVQHLANMIKSIKNRLVSLDLISIDDKYKQMITAAFQYHEQYIRDITRVFGEIFFKIKSPLPHELILKIKNYLVDDKQNADLEKEFNDSLTGHITAQGTLSRNSAFISSSSSSRSCRPCANIDTQREPDVLQSQDECKTAPDDRSTPPSSRYSSGKNKRS